MEKNTIENLSDFITFVTAAQTEQRLECLSFCPKWTRTTTDHIRILLNKFPDTNHKLLALEALEKNYLPDPSAILSKKFIDEVIAIFESDDDKCAAYNIIQRMQAKIYQNRPNADEGESSVRPNRVYAQVYLEALVNLSTLTTSVFQIIIFSYDSVNEGIQRIKAFDQQFPSDNSRLLRAVWESVRIKLVSIVNVIKSFGLIFEIQGTQSPEEIDCTKNVLNQIFFLTSFDLREILKKYHNYYSPFIVRYFADFISYVSLLEQKRESEMRKLDPNYTLLSSPFQPVTAVSSPM